MIVENDRTGKASNNFVTYNDVVCVLILLHALLYKLTKGLNKHQNNNKYKKLNKN